MRAVATRWLGPAVVLVVAVAAAAVLPGVLDDQQLGDVSGELWRAGAAAGAAVALAAGRPLLAAAALAGTGGYTSALLALHGVDVPLAVVCGAAAAAAAGALLGVAAGGVSASGFVALSLVAAIGAGAVVDAFPGTTGAAAGLGPLPPLQVPLGGGSVALLGPAGLFHVTLALMAATTVAAAVLLAVGPGPRWRAAGGDPDRAAAAGLRPIRARAAALALAGGAAGLGGALSVHLAGVATPAFFSADAAAVPLLAALAAGRAGPAVAALLAVADGILGRSLLPATGLTPTRTGAVATGILAVVALTGLIRPRRGPRAQPVEAAVDESEPWPVEPPPGGPRTLEVQNLRVAAEGGPVLVEALALRARAGAIHGLLGANGAGKSTALRAIATAAARRRPGVALTADEEAPAGGAGSAAARVVLLPQGGGGWPGCTVAETLRLAARAGGRRRREARSAAAAWLRRLALEPVAATRCEDLPAGARRRLELARALLLRPTVLLADEPLAGLDPRERALAAGALRAAAAAGTAVVLAEHDLAAVGVLASSRTELRREGGLGDLTGAVET